MKGVESCRRLSEIRREKGHFPPLPSTLGQLAENKLIMKFLVRDLLHKKRSSECSDPAFISLGCVVSVSHFSRRQWDKRSQKRSAKLMAQITRNNSRVEILILN
jgi:hypothetical protein